MGGDGDGERLVDAGQLLDRDRVGERVRPRAAPLRRDRDAEQAEPRPPDGRCRAGSGPRDRAPRRRARSPPRRTRAPSSETGGARPRGRSSAHRPRELGQETHAVAGTALAELVAAAAVEVGDTGDVEVRPGALARELLEEPGRVAGAAAALRMTSSPCPRPRSGRTACRCRGAASATACRRTSQTRTRSAPRTPHRVRRARRAGRRAPVTTAPVRVARSMTWVAPERARVVQAVGQDEPALGVGVVDLDRLAVGRGDDVVGLEGRHADHVLGRADHRHDLDRQAQARRWRRSPRARPRRPTCRTSSRPGYAPASACSRPSRTSGPCRRARGRRRPSPCAACGEGRSSAAASTIPAPRPGRGPSRAVPSTPGRGTRTVSDGCCFASSFARSASSCGPMSRGGVFWRSRARFVASVRTTESRVWARSPPRIESEPTSPGRSSAPAVRYRVKR